MTSVLPFLLLLFTTTLYAQDPVYCQLSTQEPIRTIPLKKSPDYFFKVSPDGKYIYYISQKKNYRLNTETLEEELLPGNYDPVPSPDEKIFSAIDDDFNMKLWPMDPDRKINHSGVFNFDQNRTYQSLGKLN